MQHAAKDASSQCYCSGWCSMQRHLSTNPLSWHKPAALHHDFATSFIMLCCFGITWSSAGACSGHSWRKQQAVALRKRARASVARSNAQWQRVPDAANSCITPVFIATPDDELLRHSRLMFWARYQMQSCRQFQQKSGSLADSQRQFQSLAVSFTFCWCCVHVKGFASHNQLLLLSKRKWRYLNRNRSIYMAPAEHVQADFHSYT